MERIGVNNMNVKGGTHLDLNDRIKIQSELEKGSMLKVIAAIINADERTIAKEIKKRRIRTHNNNYLNLTNEMPKNHCKKILRFPYVCNACKKRRSCKNLSFFDYRAKEAQANYERILKETRCGINIDPKTYDEVNDILKDGLRKGQSIMHIKYAHEDDIPCSTSTLYRHISNGIYDVKKIDLRRAVRFKTRKKHLQVNKKVKDKILYTGRTYEDFIRHVSTHFNHTFIIEIDTVEDPNNGNGKTLLTIHFTSIHFMIIRLLDHKNKSEVARQFKWLRKILSDDTYQNMFKTGLTDRGGEFFDVDAYEGIKEDGTRLCKLFFCNAYSSYQKGAIEENHTLLRYVLPKGTYFTDLDQDKCDLIASHINSYYRDSLKKIPYDLFVSLYSKDIADILGIRKIEAKDVKLKPELLIKTK